MGLKPWREVVTPHKNVLEGTFQESEFAADLHKVANRTASREYQDPALFFERTFITEGMRLMLESVIKRITGRGGDPVVQLQTAFGGGKTHAMLAVYHLARNEKPPSNLPGIPPILDSLGVTDLPPAHVAILDGNSLSPSQSRKKGALTINTLWGEMAWQLGGEEGYRMVEGADRDGTSPGKEILAELFSRFGPAVVLMDETVAYIRQFAEDKTYPGGTFGSNLAFLQALTEAAGHVNNAMVIASLPESDLEAGGERGKQALGQIQHLFHRLEAIWKPVSSEEGFEIVRRRIFSPLVNTAERDTVCRAYADMYIQAGNYPAETREAVYLDRLLASYPIHPQVFDRLYDDWATMENFQRTRGVLRLMAMVVHRLWVDGNKDLMIMPGSLPFYDVTVKSELLRYLPTGWDPVMERDVDGPRAQTTLLDSGDPRFGVVEAARRVARTIFLGSAPSSSGQRIRGLNGEHIRLGCTQPGQSSGVFDDALRRLSDTLYYLYSGKERYWFDTQTNLRREAEDRMNRFKLESDLLPEISRRLKTMLKGGIFGGVHVFTPHGDIPDDASIRLVVLPPVQSHIWKGKKSRALGAARKILAQRGEQPRINQNRLLFLCADENTKNILYDQVKRYLAWKSIVQDKDALNLDQHRLKEAAANQKDYDARIHGALVEAYKWILAPYQEADTRGGVTRLDWEEAKVTAGDANMAGAIAQVLVDNEMLIRQWSPFHLKNELEKWYFRNGRQDIGLLQLWNDFCRYPYLPRLVQSDVLQRTIVEGIRSKDFFAYATGKEEDRYLGLVFGSEGSVYLDAESLIVDRKAAERQQQADVPAGADGNVGVEGREYEKDSDFGRAGVGVVKDPGKQVFTPSQAQSSRSPTPTFRRFYGSVELESVKAGLDFSTIVQEVVQHFSSQVGTKVSITVEISAENEDGFPDSLRRTVQENSRTLGFKNAEFEEE
ncbi:ATP-binding protein [Desulfolithobacter sp.]